LTVVQWLVCIIAAIGFAFDIYELLMLPLIVKTAIADLHPATGTPQDWLPGGVLYVTWARTLFFVPAIAGGIFGLIGGWLTDRLGRRTVLSWSILLYAFGACAAGFSTNLYQLLFFRCCVFVGVCVEFVAAVAWLAELFPNPEQRERVLGYTQAFSSFGGLLVAVMAGLAAQYADRLPAIRGVHAAWRYTLISGLIPAIPLIVIRPFLPESPAWLRKREAGTLQRPSVLALFSPQLLSTTLVTTIVFATTFGLAFGAIQQNPQILAGHVDVQKAVTDAQDAARTKAESEGRQLDAKALGGIKGNTTDRVAAEVQKWQEIGGLAGRILLAILAVRIASRRNLFRLFQIPSLLFIPALYWWLSQNLQTAGSLQMFKYAIFLAGLLVVGQMSFWGNYIPLVFPVHLRGTGESFAANIGGRVLGTAAAYITLTLSAATPPDPARIALMGAAVAGAYALVGFFLTFLLPEPGASIEH
jgi:hypothetical protein